MQNKEINGQCGKGSNKSHSLNSLGIIPLGYSDLNGVIRGN